MKASIIFLLILIQFCPVAGQELIFKDPVLLPSQINTASEEISPLLSPDGKTLYFVRAFDPNNEGGRRAGMDIWMSVNKGKGQWSQALNKLVWNNKSNNAVIGIRKDNRVVYLLNSYNNKSGIAFSTNRNGLWTDPELISIPGIEKLNLVGFYMNPSFNVLIISMVKDDSYGKEDLYVSLRDSSDHWREPINLGPMINSEGFETAPFLSEDGKRLYFSSDGHKGFGEADIFVSERHYDNWVLWSRPKNLGKEINSEKFDSYFSIYGDSICFFSSNRTSDFSDIYKCKIGKNNKLQLKDSVEIIINEAKKLLSDLGESVNLPSGTENILFPPETPHLTKTLEDQIKMWLSKYDLNLVSVIELSNSKTKLNIEQVNAVANYLVSLGIDGSKIKDISHLGLVPKIPGTFELRIYLNSKN